MEERRGIDEWGDGADKKRGKRKREGIRGGKRE